MYKFVISFFIAWGMTQVTNISTRSIVTVVFYILGLLLLKHNDDINVSRDSKPAGILAGLFSVLYLCGDFEGILAGLENKLFCAVILIVSGIGLFFLFYNLLIAVFYYAKKAELKIEAEARLNKMSDFKFGAIAFIVCIVCWLPYLLKNFPGIMTIDSINQYAQATGIWAQNNHHPWVHTLIIKLLYNIGLAVTKNEIAAISFFTVTQMLFMAFCVAYFMVSLKQFVLSPKLYIVVLAFYALVPYQGVYAISMLKDTPFAAFCLLYSVSIMKLLQKRDRGISFKEDKWLILFSIVTGICFCLFRTNGFYAFLVLIPFIIFTFRKNLRVIIAAEAAVLLIVLLVKGPVMSAFDISQPDLVENLSMPGQQISRVIMNERELTAEQSEFLNTIMDTDRMAEGYTPYVSDWFKKLVRDKNQQYLIDNFGEFVKIYIQIGLKYPGDYLLAYRDQTIGYWFPCTDQVEIATNEGITENEFGLYTNPVIKGTIVVKINEIALKLHTMIPGIGILWSIGAIFWIIIICLCLLVLRKNGKYWILYLPAIAIFLTLMISTPVAYDFRYAYAYVFCLPLYVLLPFIIKEKN